MLGLGVLRRAVGRRPSDWLRLVAWYGPTLGLVLLRNLKHRPAGQLVGRLVAPAPAPRPTARRCVATISSPTPIEIRSVVTENSDVVEGGGRETPSSNAFGKTSVHQTMSKTAASTSTPQAAPASTAALPPTCRIRTSVKMAPPMATMSSTLSARTSAQCSIAAPVVDL